MGIHHFTFSQGLDISTDGGGKVKTCKGECRFAGRMIFADGHDSSVAYMNSPFIKPELTLGEKKVGEYMMLREKTMMEIGQELQGGNWDYIC